MNPWKNWNQDEVDKFNGPGKHLKSKEPPTITELCVKFLIGIGIALGAALILWLIFGAVLKRVWNIN